MPLWIDLLRNNSNALVTIVGAPLGPVQAFVMSDFNFGGKNTFNSALEAILGGAVHGALVGTPNSMVQSGVNAGNAFAGGNMRGRSITGGDSVMSWVSSERPSFNLDILFLAVNPGDDPLAEARNLLTLVYPTGDPNGTLYAPMNYVANYASTGAGCVSVSIGTWFQTPPLFIVTSVELTFSQKTDESGVPLYCGASISFESMRTLTLPEVQRMFVNIGIAGDLGGGAIAAINTNAAAQLAGGQAAGAGGALVAPGG